MDYLREMTLITVGITNGVIALGLVGNVLTFVVFSRAAFSKSSINIYCRAIALFDSFTIVYVVFTVGTHFVPNSSYSTNKQPISCKIMYFFITTVSPISGWLVVTFSIDQALNVAASANPNRIISALLNNRRVQLGVVVVVASIHLAAYMIIPIEIEIKNVTVVVTTSLTATFPTCTLNSISFFPTLVVVYLVESNLVPFSLMLLTTVYILRALRASARRFDSTSHALFKMSLDSSSMNIAVRTRNTSSMSPRSRRGKRARKFALNSVALSVMFFALTCPLVVLMILPSTGSFLLDSFLYRLLSIFFYVNYSIHFLAHFTVNSIFRREFLDLLKRVWPNSYPNAAQNYRNNKSFSANNVRNSFSPPR